MNSAHSARIAQATRRFCQNRHASKPSLPRTIQPQTKATQQPLSTYRQPLRTSASKQTLQDHPSILSHEQNSRSPQLQQTRFMVFATPDFQTQTGTERHHFEVLNRLHGIIGDVPYGRIDGAISRTPLKIVPVAERRNGGCTIIFKVFNAGLEQREKIVKELKGIEGIEEVKWE